MYTIKESSELTGVIVKDINQLIAHGRIRRPNRSSGEWSITEEILEEIRSLPQDLLPSYQRQLRRRAFWTKALNGVEIPASVITLARGIVEDPSLEDSHTDVILRQYAKEFVSWYKQTDPTSLSIDERRIFDRINDACEGFIELQEAMNLIRECKLITTRQLSLASGTTPTVIRKLWNQRRICPHTQNFAGHLMWKVTGSDIDQIKSHIRGDIELSEQRIQARRDIIHLTVAGDQGTIGTQDTP